MSNNTVSVAELQATLDAVKAQLAQARKEQGKSLSFKVTEKGAISVYGLQRFPVTLYYNQWEKIFKVMTEIQMFAEANKDKLAVKIAA
jgi:CRISPR/Cas system-associated exonuclease Cas4 (RecB family)